MLAATRAKSGHLTRPESNTLFKARYICFDREAPGAKDGAAAARVGMATSVRSALRRVKEGIRLDLIVPSVQNETRAGSEEPQALGIREQQRF